MPLETRYECTDCGFSLPSGAGGHMYVEDDQGKRHVCSHPLEYTIKELLGEDAPASHVVRRTGCNSDCTCLECLNQFPLDLRKDERRCRSCGSSSVKSTQELSGSACPRCSKGVITAEPFAVS